MAEVRKIGMLTGGGDAPGLNGVIRAVTMKSIEDYGYEVTMKSIEDYGYEVAGVKRGWRGLLAPEADSLMPNSAWATCATSSRRAVPSSAPPAPTPTKTRETPRRS